MHTFTPIAVLGLAAAASASAYSISPELVSTLSARDIDVEDYLSARDNLIRRNRNRASGAARAPAPPRPGRRTGAVNAGANFLSSGAEAYGTVIGRSELQARDIFNTDSDLEDYLFAREIMARQPRVKPSYSGSQPPISHSRQPSNQYSGRGPSSMTDRLERTTNTVNAGSGLLSAGREAYGMLRGRSSGEFEDDGEVELFVREEFDLEEFDY